MKVDILKMQFLTDEVTELLDTKVSGDNQMSHSIISFRMAARVYPEIFSGTIKPHTEKEYDEYRLYASRCLIIAASEAHRHIVQEKEKRKGKRKIYWERPSLPPAPVTQDSPIRSTYHAAACARGKRGERSFAHMIACVDWSSVRFDKDNFRSLIEYDIIVSNEESIEELPLVALDISNKRLPIVFRNYKIDLEYEPYWQFWRDWYQGFLDGKPLNWNLQREVALIPDADWEKGPAHIADKIEVIKARFDVQNAAKKAKEYLSQTPLPPHSGIGHNQPPEPLDLEAPPNIDLDEINEKLNQILDATDSASSNTKQLRPSDNFIKSTMISIARYIGQKADLVVDEVIKDPIKAAGYIAIATPVIDYFVGLLIKLKSLVEALTSFIPFL